MAGGSTDKSPPGNGASKVRVQTPSNRLTGVPHIRIHLVNARIYAILLFVIASCAPAPERGRVDPQLASRIASIKAIDNHAHPVRPTLSGEKPDDEYDALPVESLEAQSDAVRVRPGSPDLIEAHRAVFGGDKAKAARTYGRDYAVRVLDQLNIETMLANRVALAPGLPSP